VDKGVPEAVAEKLPPAQRYGLRVTLFVIALSLVAMPFGLLLEQVLTDGPLTRWDRGWAEAIHRRIIGNDVAVTVAKTFSDMGKPIALAILIAVAVAWLLKGGARKLAIFLVVTALGGSIVDSAAKMAVNRPRPNLPHPIIHPFGKSFPSGHAMSSLVCYGALYLVFAPVLKPAHRRILAVAIGALILGVGLSRLALGVHYVSDVVGGYILGAAWLVASVAAFEIWREDRGRRTTEPLEEGVEPEEGRELVDHPV
jgi:undecaprenyl-diphosphatase